jgi:Tol biopolymer transport system component
MTSDPADEWSPAWSPDGRSLVFSGSRLGPLDVYRMPADQSGAEGLLLKGPANKYVLSWSPDGRQILYEPGRTGSDTGSDLWLLPLDGPGNPQPFLRGAFDESGADFSPDGRWVAYESNETGRYEIFVTTFPGAGTRQRISTGGGRQPRWQRDGREIFFQSGPALMAADVNSAGDTFQVGAVRRLFEARFRTQSHGGFGVGSVYDVMPDGQRFIVNVVDEEPAPPAITIVTNWTAALQ